jgi:hypothetical protein
VSTSAIRTDESDAFGRSEWDELADMAPSLGVSLYMPTHRAGAETEQDPVRLRNHLAAAERELVALGWHPREIGELLKPVHDLLGDREFWQHQSDGLAVFCAPGVLRVLRLPIQFADLVVVAGQFHLRPMLPLITVHEKFWLLALSQNTVRLFRGTDVTIDEIDTGDTPSNMAEALAHEDLEKTRQIRSTGPNGRGQSFGHASGGEDDKAALERYFRAVDHGLAGLSLDPAMPLVLAGVSYYGPIYRAVSGHPEILEEMVEGSPDNLSAIELHDLAWTVVKPHLAARKTRWQDRFGQSRADGRTTTGLVAVATAATEGRVEVLLLPPDEHRWASPDGDPTDAGAARDVREPGDIDRLDVIAKQVFRTGGEIIVAEPNETPGEESPAAILRYP